MDFTLQINLSVPFTARSDEQAEERMEALEAWILDPVHNTAPHYAGDVEVSDFFTSLGRRIWARRSELAHSVPIR